MGDKPPQPHPLDPGLRKVFQILFGIFTIIGPVFIGIVFFTHRASIKELAFIEVYINNITVWGGIHKSCGQFNNLSWICDSYKDPKIYANPGGILPPGSGPNFLRSYYQFLFATTPLCGVAIIGIFSWNAAEFNVPLLGNKKFTNLLQNLGALCLIACILNSAATCVGFTATVDAFTTAYNYDPKENQLRAGLGRGWRYVWTGLAMLSLAYIGIWLIAWKDADFNDTKAKTEAVKQAEIDAKAKADKPKEPQVIFIPSQPV